MNNIIVYDDKYRDKVIELILNIQNVEYGINLGLDEQQDLLSIKEEYIDNGGNFWLVIDGDDDVVGTIGLLKLDDNVGVLKKFFVDARFRGSGFGVGLDLFETLLGYAREIGLGRIILDTPSVAVRSHSFYRKVGFSEIGRSELGVDYQFPDRDSKLFALII